ncbi:MAG: hypothetical protein PHS57_10220 [Alphaproteobacteria bacterium]|nr:hypothetical protein [Alphaproteobacteria bacterium]
MNAGLTLDVVFAMAFGDILELREKDLRRLLAQAEIVARSLRGALRQKNGEARG